MAEHDKLGKWDDKGDQIALAVQLIVPMSARLAGYTAMGCSSIALVMVSLFVPALWDKINSITIDLHKDMEEFRQLQNGVWTNIQGERRAVAGIVARTKRQSYNCSK
ncbi:nematode cuticle collagen domain protein [Teladorsagia circumcincta]|uniref:Nematode cuticle collagen domain protein n=1 Tax=Teladorsagia circumcincta TaxID=45464 RepID=A0A2G9TYL3_TELCI|nr:nematode cuticle collagen domain protein [Teladorsagia circumcincta]